MVSWADELKSKIDRFETKVNELDDAFRRVAEEVQATGVVMGVKRDSVDPPVWEIGIAGVIREIAYSEIKQARKDAAYDRFGNPGTFENNDSIEDDLRRLLSTKFSWD